MTKEDCYCDLGRFLFFEALINLTVMFSCALVNNTSGQGRHRRDGFIYFIKLNVGGGGLYTFSEGAICKLFHLIKHNRQDGKQETMGACFYSELKTRSLAGREVRKWMEVPGRVSRSMIRARLVVEP